jgi:hypothetical protein
LRRGIFRDTTSTGLPAVIQARVLGDVDGDLDSMFGNDGQTYLYSNVTRQIAWRGVPRVGKALTIDVYGAPGGV